LFIFLALFRHGAWVDYRRGRLLGAAIPILIVAWLTATRAGIIGAVVVLGRRSTDERAAMFVVLTCILPWNLWRR
jgi:hypothetical protein